jgi:DNA-binding NtrC family response regulator
LGRPTLLVVRVTDAFAEIWEGLAEALGVSLRLVRPEDAGSLGSGVGAVVLAAGGAERKAADWLERGPLARAPSVAVVGADPGRRAAALLVRAGAADYFALPGDVELLRGFLSNAIAEFRAGPRRNGDGGVVSAAFDGVVAESRAMRTVLAQADRLAHHSDSAALLVGETGTGKELLARAIHESGARRTGPFVPVSCALIPGHLVESELFGHERGAFTDATAANPGVFEVAEGGTLFLDEVGELPVEVQARLLRALEEKPVRRLGGVRPRGADVRVIAATSTEPEGAAEAGGLRGDLYYRLSVVTLRLPPLRERPEDIEPLARQFIAVLAAEYGLAVPALDEAEFEMLRSHDWPGNVRELKNVVERAMLLAEPGRPVLDGFTVDAHRGNGAGGPLPFPATLDAIEGAAARAMVDVCEGNRSEAARRLSISRGRLRRLLGLAEGNGAREGAHES